MRGHGTGNDEEGPHGALERMLKMNAESGGVKGQFNDYLDGLATESREDEGIGGFMVAYRLTGEAKVKGVCEFIETLCDNGAKFLVFAHHRSVMEEL